MSMPFSPLAAWRRWQAMREWATRGFAAPSPDHVKRTVLLRLSLPGCTWVETGTYRGETTALLAGVSRRVVSLEPAPALHAAAVARFAGRPNVQILNATSEQAFGTLLPTLDARPRMPPARIRACPIGGRTIPIRRCATAASSAPKP